MCDTLFLIDQTPGAGLFLADEALQLVALPEVALLLAAPEPDATLLSQDAALNLWDDTPRDLGGGGSASGCCEPILFDDELLIFDHDCLMIGVAA